SGATENTESESALKPKSTRATLAKLCANQPASTSSAIDSAICAVVSDVRNRAAFLPPVDRTPWDCSAGLDSTRISFSAGIRPNTSVETTASPTVIATTFTLKPKSNVVAAKFGSNDATPRNATNVNGRLASAAPAASSNTSASNRPSSRNREAPSEARVAISPTRVEPRASSRFATFTQAISSTSPVETSKIVSGARALTSTSLWPCPPGSRDSVLAQNSVSICSLKPLSSGASTSFVIVRYGSLIAAAACSSDTPGFKRANRYAQ